jgi:hypothetical protein
MDAFVLKTIATLCMLADHIGAVFPESTPFILRCIGRIAFPIYAYMAAYSCARTGSIDRYMLRLGIFALVSEAPFDAAFVYNLDFLSETNIFYSLFLGVAGVNVYERVKSLVSRSAIGPPPSLAGEGPADTPGMPLDAPARRAAKGFLAVLAAVLPVLPAIPIIALGDALTTDYGSLAPALILAMHIAGSERARLLVMLCGVIVLYVPYVTDPGWGILYGAMLLAFAIAAVVLIALYNGRRGIRLKWAFYCFYPAHIAALALARAFLAAA